MPWRLGAGDSLGGLKFLHLSAHLKASSFIGSKNLSLILCLIYSSFHSWEMYDTIEDIDKLMKALARQGERESALKGAISGQYKTITSLIKKKLPEHSELKPYDTFEESIKILKEVNYQSLFLTVMETYDVN